MLKDFSCKYSGISEQKTNLNSSAPVNCFTFCKVQKPLLSLYKANDTRGYNSEFDERLTLPLANRNDGKSQKG